MKAAKAVAAKGQPLAPVGAAKATIRFHDGEGRQWLARRGRKGGGSKLSKGAAFGACRGRGDERDVGMRLS